MIYNKKIITKHHRQKINNNGTDAKLFVNVVYKCYMSEQITSRCAVRIDFYLFLHAHWHQHKQRIRLFIGGFNCCW